ncbi:hypothetical protein HF1_02840 [Mycoplasma haemofelis str. Langford 1]|uniref:Secreted protein n=1 Tax=Mycoplasma haemofelis (strain Langford 1) TaxID=941640 RepID=E8ZGM1_MYCHL|nr:hypothetical protein [Mycoplasma haemofelis]CBY92292.1 hypothetical protein HF1_02840 [Mycoplasma haemofelis str. Langford 1]
MTSSLLPKVALGLGAASATAAGAAYAGGAFSPSGELISKLIKTANPDKREITSTSGEDTNWKEAWKRYRQDNKSKNTGEDVWKLKDWQKPEAGTINNDVAAPTSFIDECKSRLSKKVSGTESDLYKEVLKYCVRDTLVSDLVSETTGKTSLVDVEDSTNWDRVWNLYKTHNNGKENGQDTWALNDWKQEKEKPNAPQSFKTACKNKLATKTGDKSHPDYLNFLSWCTK